MFLLRLNRNIGKVMSLKSKQDELQDNLSYLISQNYHLMNENRKLWGELLKQKYY